MIDERLLTIVNNAAAIDEMYPEDEDRVDSWDASLYADAQYLSAPEWGCGVQPHSRGNPSAAAGITEREWRQRHDQ